MTKHDAIDQLARQCERKTHGGTRPGAGRKTGSTKPTARRAGISVRLSENELDQDRAIGEGNASAGVRKALDWYDGPPRRGPA